MNMRNAHKFSATEPQGKRGIDFLLLHSESEYSQNITFTNRGGLKT
jgi:hypothetical protein